MLQPLLILHLLRLMVIVRSTHLHYFPSKPPSMTGISVNVSQPGDKWEIVRRQLSTSSRSRSSNAITYC